MAGRMRHRSVPPTGLPPGVPGPGSRVADRYLVEGVLARGGMGIVLTAHHETLQQRVAIKVLLPEVARDRASAARFAREAQAIAQLQCDNVVRVMDVGTLPSGLPFMVMEHLTGCDLEEQLRRSGPFSVADAVDVVLQACVAVAEAHARGIVHRDLKPSNLFRNHTPDGASTVKVLDFGISKSMFGANGDRNANTTVSVWGSPLYMAPEQVLSSKQIGPPTDIWSLGVILYELLTAALPFQADSLVDVCDSIVSGPPRALSSVRPELPEALCAVVERCLEKEAGRRWPNVGAFASALVPFAAPRAAQYAQRALHLASVDPISGAGVLSSRRSSAPASMPGPMSMPMPSGPGGEGSWATTRLLERRRPKTGLRTLAACGAALAVGLAGASAWTLLSHSRGRVGGPLMATSQLSPPALSATAALAPAVEAREAPKPAAAVRPADAARPADAPAKASAAAEPPPAAPLRDDAAPSAHPPAAHAPAHAASPPAARPATRPAPPAAGGEGPLSGPGVLRDLSHDRK